jgi:hypothetical protein
MSLDEARSAGIETWEGVFLVVKDFHKSINEVVVVEDHTCRGMDFYPTSMPKPRSFFEVANACMGKIDEDDPNSSCWLFRRELKHLFPVPVQMTARLVMGRRGLNVVALQDTVLEFLTLAEISAENESAPVLGTPHARDLWDRHRVPIGPKVEPLGYKAVGREEAQRLVNVGGFGLNLPPYGDDMESFGGYQVFSHRFGVTEGSVMGANTGWWPARFLPYGQFHRRGGGLDMPLPIVSEWHECNMLYYIIAGDVGVIGLHETKNVLPGGCVSSETGLDGNLSVPITPYRSDYGGGRPFEQQLVRLKKGDLVSAEGGGHLVFFYTGKPLEGEGEVTILRYGQVSCARDLGRLKLLRAQGGSLTKKKGPPRCIGCGSSGAKVCSRCGLHTFCGSTCLKAHYKKKHKACCERVQKYGGNIPGCPAKFVR